MLFRSHTEKGVFLPRISYPNLITLNEIKYFIMSMSININTMYTSKKAVFSEALFFAKNKQVLFLSSTRIL